MRTGWLVLGSSVAWLALQACGGTSRSSGTGVAGGGGHDGGVAVGGTTATAAGGSGGARPTTGGGPSVTGGTTELGGAATGAAGADTGEAGDSAVGADACIEGAPCNCKALPGVTRCTSLGAECSCPPAGVCEEHDGTPCFEACGGEPFGVWRLEASCFADTHLAPSPGCEPFLSATSERSAITLKLTDGGDFAAYGEEQWTVSARVTPACLGIESVARCSDATYYTEMVLFSEATPGGCVRNACGVCDCHGDVAGGAYAGGNWSRAGNQLTLGATTMDYCVNGDVLWIGGKANGVAKASYKFSKHSCQGTPVPCAQRTPEQCAQGGACTAGHCKGKSAAQPGCAVYSEQECGTTEGCVWDPAGCYGDEIPPCSYDNCDTELGCAWGAPVQRCAGEPTPCCQAIVSELGDCALLDAASCRNAVGCQLTSTGCIGEPACWSETDAAICKGLGCAFPAGCKSTPCALLSVADCHTVPGCRLEW